MARLGRGKPFKPLIEVPISRLTATPPPTFGYLTTAQVTPPTQNVYGSQVVNAIVITSATPPTPPIPVILTGTSAPQPVFPSQVVPAPAVVGVGSIAQAPIQISGVAAVPQPLSSVQVVAGVNPSVVETVPVPDVIQSSPTPVTVYGDVVFPGASLLQAPPTAIGIQSAAVPQPPPTVHSFLGLQPGTPPPPPPFEVAAVQSSTPPQTVYGSQIFVALIPGNPPLPTVAPAFPTSSSKPQSVPSAQVVLGQAPQLVETVPVPVVVSTQAIAQPPTAAKVTGGITIGVPPPAVSLQNIVISAANVPQTVYGSQILPGITIGNPPPPPVAVLIAGASTPQVVFGSQVQFGAPVSLDETVPLPTLISSVAVTQPAQLAKHYVGLFVAPPFVSTITAKRIEQPVTSVRVLGGITIGTPPPISVAPSGLAGVTAPTNAEGGTAPSTLYGLTKPSELTGVVK